MDKPGLLASKFFQPVLPTNLVRRRHLVARLNDGLASGRSVSLLSAPAGFGRLHPGQHDHVIRLVAHRVNRGHGRM